jgi:hypothetical protein
MAHQVTLVDVGERADRWLPDPAVRVRHRRTAHVTPDELWEAAERVRLDETRTLGRLVRWRIPGLREEITFRDTFREYPFTELEGGVDWTISGLAGRIWTLKRDYPRLESPQEFAEWDERGTVRVVFAHWVEDDPAGAALVSDCRVQPVDGFASMRLKALWRLIGVFERLIGNEAMTAAIRRAEGRRV